MDMILGLIFSLPAAPTYAISRMRSGFGHVSKCTQVSILVRYVWCQTFRFQKSCPQRGRSKSFAVWRGARTGEPLAR